MKNSVNSAYYFFDKKGYRFIVLDANWEPRYSIHTTGILWLEQKLFEAKELGLKAIIFIYQGLDTRDHAHVIQNAREVREVIEQVGNVFAIFQGHTHSGGYWYINGTYYIGIRAMVNHPISTFAIAKVWDDGTIDIKGYGEQRDYWLWPN